jgi:putative transposase
LARFFCFLRETAKKRQKSEIPLFPRLLRPDKSNTFFKKLHPSPEGVRRVYRAYKYRIYPTKAQEVLIDKTFGCVRFIYNKLLSERQAWYEAHKDAPGETFRPLLSQYKKDYPWLKEVDSLALANAQLHLEKAYGNFFKDKTFGFPRFKSKKCSRQSYTTNNQKGSVRVVDEKTLRLPKLKDVKIKLHRSLPPLSLIKGATVSKSASGKYYAAILFTAEKEDGKIEDRNLGEQIPPLLPSADKEPAAPRRERNRLKRLRKSLTRGKRGSKKSVKKRRTIILLQEKAANRKKDRLHKLSRRIANALREHTPIDKYLCLSNPVNRTPVAGLFKTFLTYKLSG